MDCAEITIDPSKGKPNYSKRDAIPEGNSEFRYLLSRYWDDSLPKVCYIGLNPSTATATESDITMTKLAKAANQMGFGGMNLVNLFPVRSENPQDIEQHDSPLGENNDEYIKRAAKDAEAVFAVWGQKGRKYPERVSEVVELVDKEIFILDENQDGSPMHGGARNNFYDRLAPQPLDPKRHKS